jgi:uncharacterized protein YjbJ (UPF0337 family)
LEDNCKCTVDNRAFSDQSLGKGELYMNTDTFEGQWRQMRGDLRSWWGKLSESDFEKIAGRKDRLIGMLQEKYGHTREAAQQEVDRRFREYEERRHTSTLTQPSGTTAKGTNDTRAAQPVASVGERIGSLAETIREKAPHEGAVGTAATAVAEKLDVAGSYLQEKDLNHVLGDVSSMIRRYPVPALLIGLGVGYLLARSVRR